MVKLELILLISCTIQLCPCSRITRNVDEQSQEITPEELNRLEKNGLYTKLYREMKSVGLTIDQVEKIHEIHAPKPLNEACTILLPDHKESYINETTIQYLVHLSDALEILRVPDVKVRLLFLRQILCPYISNPELLERYAKTLKLRMADYFRFERIKQGSVGTNLSHVAMARECVKCFLLHLKLTILHKLNEVESEQFDEFWKQTEIAEESTRESAYYEGLIIDDYMVNNSFLKLNFNIFLRKICAISYETIPLVEQAKEQKIPVEIYAKIVAFYKDLASNDSVENQVNYTRQICRDINLSYGLPARNVSENSLSDESVLRDMYNIWNTISSYTKIYALKYACIHLNETISIGETAQHIGLTTTEYSDFQAIANNSDAQPSHEYYYEKITQMTYLCNTLKSRDEPMSPNSWFGDEYIYFIYSSLQIFTIPIGERRALMRKICNEIPILN